MIGDFVNDAKLLVQNSWNWSQLRTTFEITTVASTQNYALTGTDSHGRLLFLYNDTSNWRMTQRSAEWFADKEYLQDSSEGAPTDFRFAEDDSNGDQTIDLYPTPDAVYTLRAELTLPQTELTTGTDDILVPEMPVVHLAVALAARERGETGGTSVAEYFDIANQFLADAIAIDVATRDEETVWHEV